MDFVRPLGLKEIRQRQSDEQITQVERV